MWDGGATILLPFLLLPLLSLDWAPQALSLCCLPCSLRIHLHLIVVYGGGRIPLFAALHGSRPGPIPLDLLVPSACLLQGQRRGAAGDAESKASPRLLCRPSSSSSGRRRQHASASRIGQGGALRREQVGGGGHPLQSSCASNPSGGEGGGHADARDVGHAAAGGWEVVVGAEVLPQGELRGEQGAPASASEGEEVDGGRRGQSLLPQSEPRCLTESETRCGALRGDRPLAVPKAASTCWRRGSRQRLGRGGRLP